MTLTADRSADVSRPAVAFLDGRAGLRLRGELDTLSTGALREAIAALPADLREVHLELAGLSFIDVGGTRVLLGLARCPQRRLVLHQPPRSLLRLIHLLCPGCLLAPSPSGSPSGDREDRSTTYSIQPS
jgi:anti-anti-sigma factor